MTSEELESELVKDGLQRLISASLIAYVTVAEVNVSSRNADMQVLYSTDRAAWIRCTSEMHREYKDKERSY